MLKSVEDKRVETAASPAPDRRRAGGGPLRAVAQVALMGAVLAGSYLAMNRLIAARPERTARPQVETLLPVEAVTVSLKAEQPVLRLYGEVVAARAIDIRPSAAGEVVAVHPSLSAGQRIAEGDVLFEIDPFDTQMALAEARANLAQTEATIVENEARLRAERDQLRIAEEQLELARTDATRAAQLARSGALNQKQLDDRTLILSQREQAVSTRQNNIAIEEARLAQQRAVRERLALGVARAERALGETVIRAPMSGIVRSATIEPGRIVSANDVAVAMYDDTALDVRFTLTDAQYGRVATDAEPLVGRKAEIVWTVGNTGYRYGATVTRLGADIASARGGIDVFARIDAAGEREVDLRPGAFVEVSLPDRTWQGAARIPESALHGSDMVYLVTPENTLESRKVTVAAYDGSDIIVSAGLADGERVLATRLSSVEPGLKVSVDGDPAPARPAGPASADLVEAARQKAGLTEAQWEALPREERRRHIEAARTQTDTGS